MEKDDVKQVLMHTTERLKRAVTKQNQNAGFVETPFVQGEQHKFGVSIEDLDKQVREVAVSLKNIRSFSCFSTNLHETVIRLSIKHGDSNISANFSSHLQKPDK